MIQGICLQDFLFYPLDTVSASVSSLLQCRVNVPAKDPSLYLPVPNSLSQTASPPEKSTESTAVVRFWSHWKCWEPTLSTHRGQGPQMPTGFSWFCEKGLVETLGHDECSVTVLMCTVANVLQLLMCQELIVSNWIKWNVLVWPGFHTRGPFII